MLPKEILVGKLPYTINGDASLSTDAGNLGVHRRDRLTITIDAGYPEQIQLHTLWHELLHALSSQYSLDLDERACDSLAYGMIALLMDNPELLDITLGIDIE